MGDASDELISAIDAERGLILVLTGAGISLASGIPTFRGTDPGAIWARDITELATLRYFVSDPVGSWRWYRQRFLGVLAARPNPAHGALAALERWQAARRGDFLLVTQNIDTLHEQAGSTRLVKVHGSADRCRCSDPSCRLGAIDSLALDEVDFSGFDLDPRAAAVPQCPSCGAIVRPHVLWFDEVLHQPRGLSVALRGRGRRAPAALALRRDFARRRRDLIPAVSRGECRGAGLPGGSGRSSQRGAPIEHSRPRESGGTPSGDVSSVEDSRLPRLTVAPSRPMPFSVEGNFVCNYFGHPS